MALIVIDRLVYALPGLQRLQVAHQMVDFLGCRIVIVDVCNDREALFLGLVVAIVAHGMVVGIFAKHHGPVRTEMCEQGFCQR